MMSLLVAASGKTAAKRGIDAKCHYNRSSSIGAPIMVRHRISPFLLGCIVAIATTSAHGARLCYDVTDPISFSPAQPDSAQVTFVTLQLGAKFAATAIEGDIAGGVITLTSYGFPPGVQGPYPTCETVAIGPLPPGTYEIRHMRGGITPASGGTPTLLGTYPFAVSGSASSAPRASVLIPGLEKKVDNVGASPDGTSFAFDVINIGTADLTFGIAYPRGQVVPSLTCTDGAALLRPGERCSAVVPVTKANLLPADDTIGTGAATVDLVINGGQIVLPFTVQYSSYGHALAADDAPLGFGAHMIGGAPATLAREFRNVSAHTVDIAFGLRADRPAECDGIPLAPMACQGLIDAAAASYALATAGCQGVPPQGTCMATVTFDPKAPAALEATLVADAGPYLNTFEVPLRGAGIPPRMIAESALAIEYRHAAFDHYFVTAAAAEIAALDDGRFTGWARTGRSFWVYPADAAAPPGTSPVCRFYGRPEAGLDSHFYSASADECADVAMRFGASWILESEHVFAVKVPDGNGVCPVGTSPLYRVFNARKDANHRYTTDRAVRDAMVQLGGTAEGTGTDTVAMCVPQ